MSGTCLISILHNVFLHCVILSLLMYRILARFAPRDFILSEPYSDPLSTELFELETIIANFWRMST
jgi:hypothetical protein